MSLSVNSEFYIRLEDFVTAYPSLYLSALAANLNALILCIQIKMSPTVGQIKEIFVPQWGTDKGRGKYDL